jgi:ribose transport system substrate-binding protein
MKLLRITVAIVAAIWSGSVLAEGKTIGYAVMGYNHPLFQAMMAGAQKAAKQLHVNVPMVDAQFDVNKQIAQIQDFTTRRVDALLVNPVTAKETVPVLKQAHDAGIPVIAIDTRPVGFEPDAFISMNHYQGGYIMGWKVATDLNCRGRWAAIWAIGNEQAASRMRGFEAALGENCRVRGLPDKFEKEGEYSGITGPLRETSRHIAETLLTKYPNGQLAFIFGQTDEFANGAYLAAQAAGREDVKIYGMDNNEDMLAFIKEGKNMIATTAHLPVQIGEAAVQTALNILEGKPYMKEIQLNFQLIDQNNVQYAHGWDGTDKPSFSEFAFPEQLGVLNASLGK